jgi:hypothetical protein
MFLWHVKFSLECAAPSTGRQQFLLSCVNLKFYVIFLYFRISGLEFSFESAQQLSSVPFEPFVEVSWLNVKRIPGVTADCGHTQCLYIGRVGSGYCRLPVAAVDKPPIYHIDRTDMQCWLLLANVTALSWLLVGRSVEVPIYNVICIATNMISVCYLHCIGKWTLRQENCHLSWWTDIHAHCL